MPRGGLLLNAVSEEWLRCDLSIVTPDNFGRRAKNTVKPLIDRDGRYDALPDTLPLKQPDKGTVTYLIHEFILHAGARPRWCRPG
ncbi:hypothetical protein N8D56_12685 [Devosia sp. A8/3-2]|nr:hypothetical protein N8D56_12685 [Devosia sp. A8/3-2]